ncbi:MAG: C40 family peptidase [Clostridia bacterium]|nr:C40 family peptidase [Clostridia bacterium]
MGDIVIKFAEADGIKLSFNTMTFDTITNPENTYNFYELFSWDGSNADSKVTAAKQSWVKGALNEPEKYKYDMFIAQVSRDRGIAIPAGHARNGTAMEYLTKELNRVYPGIKTVLLVPSGYKDGNKSAVAKKIGLTQTTYEEHNEAIRENAKYLTDRVSGDKSAVYICDAFDYFESNYASLGIDLYDTNQLTPSMAGAYYAACVFYSSVFGNATSGMTCYGYLDDTELCLKLQAAADKYVSSTGKTLKPHAQNRTIHPMTLEQADPRNRPIDPKYAHEVYPQYYDELLASAFAYVQRGGLIQYDNLNMDRAAGTFSRREVEICSPEDATPQNLLYSDCSAFVYACYLDAYGFDFNGATRSASIYSNTELATSAARVWHWDGTTDKRTPEELSKELMSIIQPGDILDYADSSLSGGHIMIYIGNGKMIHLTGKHAFGGGENYIYGNGTDAYEMIEGVLYDDIEEATIPGHWLCVLNSGHPYWVLYRVSNLGVKPTAQAKNRLNNLRNIVAYKLTTAPHGVTVNPGSDVTFTIVINNLDYTAKTVNITDKLSQGVSFKSGKDFKVSGSDLSATVSVPAGGKAEVSYTVTVDKSVAPGTSISCHNTYLNGVLHNDAPILVGKTLTPEQQNAIPTAADKAGASASTDYALISEVYKSAFSKTLPFSSAQEMFRAVFDIVPSNPANNFKLKLPVSAYLAGNLFGGQRFNYSKSQREPYRIKRITTEFFIPGDILLTTKAVNGEAEHAYLYLGNGSFATVENGKYEKYTKTQGQALVESLLGQYAYCVLRPSLTF